MKTQIELTDIWDAIGAGKYGTDPADSRPRRVVDDANEQVMSIPTGDGTALDDYSRTPGGLWEPTRYTRQHP